MLTFIVFGIFACQSKDSETNYEPVTAVDLRPNVRVESVEEQLKDSSINPRDIKRELAKDLVSRYYNDSDAQRAEEAFDQIFVKKDVPDEMPTFNLSSDSVLIDVLVSEELVSSKGEAKRLIGQNAVKINGSLGGVKRLVSSYDLDVETNGLLRPTGFANGFFTQDWQYDADGDLDEFNGRFCETPEFPNGTYAYFSPITNGGDVAYP